MNASFENTLQILGYKSCKINRFSTFIDILQVSLTSLSIAHWRGVCCDGVYTVCVMMDPGQRWRCGQAAARNQRQTSSPPTELHPVDIVQGWANLWLQSSRTL